MKKSEYDKSLIRRNIELKDEKRRRFWRWRAGSRDFLRGVSSYKYWSLPSLLVFLTLTILVVVIVFKCEAWLASMYYSTIPY